MKTYVPIDPLALQSACREHQCIGRQIVVRQETDSTNEDCHRLAGNADDAGLVVLAEGQTAGRGQHGRVWSAPEGSSLLMSIALFPPPALVHPGFLTSWSAVAIAELLDEEFALVPRIKWPNDVLVAGRKIGGILVERRTATVVGIGLNVSIQPEQFPRELRHPATSLFIELGSAPDRIGLACSLLRRLDRLYAESLAFGPEPLSTDWTRYSQGIIGESAGIVTARATQWGTLLDLRPDRGARLRLDHGEVCHIAPEQILRVLFEGEGTLAERTRSPDSP